MSTPPPRAQRTASPTAGGADRGVGGQGCIGREGTSEGALRRLGRRLEGVATAVGAGYCGLQMPLKPALAVRGTVAGRRLGALERGDPFQCISGNGGWSMYSPAQRWRLEVYWEPPPPPLPWSVLVVPPNAVQVALNIVLILCRLEIVEFERAAKMHQTQVPPLGACTAPPPPLPWGGAYPNNRLPRGPGWAFGPRLPISVHGRTWVGVAGAVRKADPDDQQALACVPPSVNVRRPLYGHAGTASRSPAMPCGVQTALRNA